MIEQRGLSNHLASLISELGLTSQGRDRADRAAELCDLGLAVPRRSMVGARVHVCGNSVVQDPMLLAREIEREGITVLEIVPSLLRVILERLDERADAARLCEAAAADLDRRAAAGRSLPRLVRPLPEGAADQRLWRLGMF